MVHASLFSGIGGFDLAAEWMGWENAFHCEINEWCSKVLKYHYPNSKHYADITKTDFTEWRGRVDIITGGFPCQPFSLAGQRKGANDDRYLWPEMLRVIREIRPSWIVGENVGGIATMVQPGEETKVAYQPSLFEEGNQETILEQEFVIETICRDLESEGYSVQPILIPACAVGAPHRRDRIWFIANRDDGQCIEQEGEVQTRRNTSDGGGKEPITHAQRDGSRQIHKEVQAGQSNGCGTNSVSHEWDVTNSNHELFKQWMLKGQEGWNNENVRIKSSYCEGSWQDFPTQSPVCSGDDGFPPRLDGITFSKWRTESIKAYGNAIVPHPAYEIFKVIEKVNNMSL